MSIKKFLLRGIEPSKIEAAYRQGAFDNLGLPKDKVKNKIKAMTFNKILSDSCDKPMFMIKTQKGEFNMATTNVSNYDEFLKTGKFPSKGCCDWCRKEFDHGDKPLSSGIPMKRVIEEDTYIYYVDNIMCSDECSLAYIRHFKLGQQALYNSSEVLLKELHSLRFPESQELVEAPYFRLHIRNGGSLEDKDYYNFDNKYTAMPNLILAPVKMEFRKETR